MKSKQGIDLDETVEIAKEDGDRVEQEVLRMATPETEKLDDLGEEEYPGQLGNQGIEAGIGVPIGCAPPQREKNQGVSNKGQRGEGRQVKSVSTPRLLTTIPKNNKH